MSRKIDSVGKAAAAGYKMTFDSVGGFYRDKISYFYSHPLTHKIFTDEQHLRSME
jgi:hypothetical protein